MMSAHAPIAETRADTRTATTPDLRYGKGVRLCSKKDIDRVFGSGQYRRLGVLHAKWLRTERPEARFMVSVRRKIGKAPRRNRIRRLVKEAIRLNRHRLQGAYDICFFLTTAPKHPALSEFETELRRLFEALSHPPA